MPLYRMLVTAFSRSRGTNDIRDDVRLVLMCGWCVVDLYGTWRDMVSLVICNDEGRVA